MWYQIIIISGLFVFAFNLIMNLRSLRRPDPTASLPNETPFVSILIPARNEDENIGKCLASLVNQDYPGYEILVLDDNSSDRTSEVVAGFVENSEKVRLVHGKELPDDWAGKPFACHQLAEHARGSWLLFVDADTIHKPFMLRSVMALALETKPSLISGFPRQSTPQITQKISIPLIYFIILGWMPLWWLRRQKKPQPAFSFGQFLLFQKAEYERIGGHRCVKARIIEDVFLGLEMAKAGGRQLTVDLSGVVSCTMYRGLVATWEGFIKWIYSVACVFPLAILFLGAIAYFFFLAPFYWLWKGFTDITMVGLLPLVIGQCLLIIGMRWMLMARFKDAMVSVPAHPLSFSLLFIVVGFGLYRWLSGTGVSWKERVYDRNSSIH